jgi:hypothetical protein
MKTVKGPGGIRKRIEKSKRKLLAFDGSVESGRTFMNRIASLAVLLAALIEYAMEHASFDLWVATVALLALLWNLVG